MHFNPTFKKAISLVLAIGMLFSQTPVSFAARQTSTAESTSLWSQLASALGVPGRLPAFARSEMRKLDSINPTATLAWSLLLGDRERMTHALGHDLNTLLTNAERTKLLTAEFQSGPVKMLADFAKQRVDRRTLENLLKLAQETKLGDAINKMFGGDKINETEDRAVLHVALRAPRDQKIELDGTNVVDLVHRVIDRMEALVRKVHSGEWKGYDGDEITDVVNIGIGGSDLGPVMVTEALKAYRTGKVRVHFVSNVDGTDIAEKLKHLNPKTTLFLVASKTFTTQETMTNAHTAREWFLKNGGNVEAIKKHFIALSTNKAEVEKFGIDPANMFEFWDWVGGRFSLWSAIGLSIMMDIGADNFKELLAGAHDMDEHFRTMPFEKNIPVLMALMNIWNTNFLGSPVQAILPYDQYLHRFPAYLQQGIMESNGKRVDRSGHEVRYATSPVIFGEPGTNGQHSFYQLLHQGKVPFSADFIGFAQTLNRAGDHHEKLLANLLAQPAAMALGKSRQTVEAEGTKPGVAPHKVFTGNIPTTTILMNKLTPRALGALVAAYEHRIFAEGVIWNIFSFDQWGVELGKVQAGPILAELKDDKTHANVDTSTRQLADWLKAHRSEMRGRSLKNVTSQKEAVAAGVLRSSQVAMKLTHLQFYAETTGKGAIKIWMQHSPRSKGSKFVRNVAKLLKAFPNDLKLQSWGDDGHTAWLQVITPVDAEHFAVEPSSELVVGYTRKGAPIYAEPQRLRLKQPGRSELRLTGLSPETAVRAAGIFTNAPGSVAILPSDAVDSGFVVPARLVLKGTVVAVASNRSELRALEQLNASLPAGTLPVQIAASLEEAVQFARQEAQLQAAALGQSISEIIAYVTDPLSIEAERLKQLLGKGNVRSVLASQFKRVLEVTGLDVLVQEFKAIMAARQAA